MSMSLRAATVAGLLVLAIAATTPDRPLAAHEGHHPHKHKARGHVFQDLNGNRKRDDGEPPVRGVRVSNGSDIVETNESGGYELGVDDDSILFVIKPRGFQTVIGSNQLPQFYYIHKPKGSPKSMHPGVAPTGDLPAAIDFPLYEQKEPRQFSSIFFGDPQPRNQREIDYIAHDVVEDLIGTKAAFGVTLGDILFDDLSLFESMNRTVGKIGIPWYNVIGNHDLNTDSPDDRHSDETFNRYFGPTYYSYNYGPVHFVVLDDVVWTGKDEDGGHYHAGLGKQQLQFLRNDLKSVPRDQLVVLMMHIPLVNSTPWKEDERKALYELIKDRPNCVSISAHAHTHEHVMVGEKDGFPAGQQHHHIVNVTVSGAWWQGAPNEYGTPHATMADGAPNGYSVMHFDGSKYRLSFRAAGRPARFQMHIDAPEEVKVADLGKTFVYANVFNALPTAKIRFQVGDGGPRDMQRSVEPDPVAQRIRVSETVLQDRTWLDPPEAKPSSHLWKAILPDDLPPGTHVIEVSGETHDGKVARDRRIIRVVK